MPEIIAILEVKDSATLRSASLHVIAFAEKLGIASGIVVGRLQHDEHVYLSAFNDLKRKLDWK